MRTIAIVNEEKNMINYMTAIINSLHLDVSVIGFTQSGSEACSLLRTLKPDIIVIDTWLPGFDGLSLIEYTKPFLPNSAYIVVTKSEDYECARRALSLGVLDYLSKPLTEENLRAALEKALDHLDSVYTRLQHDESNRILDIYRSCLSRPGADIKVLFRALDRLKTRLPFEDYKNRLYKLLCVMTAITLTEDAPLPAQLSRLPSSRELYSAMSYQELDNYTGNYISQLIGTDKLTMPDSNNDALAKARLYIEENYNKDISLEKLAEIVHMNPTYFSVIFKKSVGMTYVKYITALRIEKSKRLLEEGERITDICYAVGYNNYRYFCSVFKKITGQSPSDYRETVKHTPVNQH